MGYRKFLILLILNGLLYTSCAPQQQDSIPTHAQESPLPLAYLATSTPELPTPNSPTATMAPVELFHSDFSSPVESWNNQVGKDEKVNYKNPGYQIILPKTDQKASRLLDVNVKDIILTYQYNASLTNTNNYPNSFLGTYCRYQDAQNFYAVGIFKPTPKGGYTFGIAKMIKGELNMIMQVPMTTSFGPERPYNIGKPEQITVNGKPQYLETIENRCIGDQISLYLDNYLVLNTHDSTFSSGDAGIGFWSGSSDSGKPSSWLLTSLVAKNLSGLTQDGLEWKTAQGEEFIIFNGESHNPSESILCQNAKTIMDDYEGLALTCENGSMMSFFHKSKTSTPWSDLRGNGFYPSFQNMVVESDLSMVKGDNRIGFVIGGGFVDNIEKIYFIYLDHGTFKIERCINELCRVIFGNHSLGNNPNINPLIKSNHVKIMVIHGMLYFYINNILQAQLVGENIPYTLFGILYSYNNVVSYKNLVVRIPSRSEMNQAP